MCIWTRHFFILNAWGVLLEFLGGGELIGSQVLTLFQTKTCHFPHPFSGQISKIQTCFQTWTLGRNICHQL